MPILYSKVSGKGQVTLPKKVRETLKAKPGSTVVYEIKETTVTLRRMEPIDLAFHEALSGTLQEWLTKEDEEAFRDL